MAPSTAPESPFHPSGGLCARREPLRPLRCPCETATRPVSRAPRAGTCCPCAQEPGQDGQTRHRAQPLPSASDAEDRGVCHAGDPVSHADGTLLRRALAVRPQGAAGVCESTLPAHEAGGGGELVRPQGAVCGKRRECRHRPGHTEAWGLVTGAGRPRSEAGLSQSPRPRSEEADGWSVLGLTQRAGHVRPRLPPASGGPSLPGHLLPDVTCLCQSRGIRHTARCRRGDREVLQARLPSATPSASSACRGQAGGAGPPRGTGAPTPQGPGLTIGATEHEGPRARALPEGPCRNPGAGVDAGRVVAGGGDGAVAVCTPGFRRGRAALTEACAVVGEAQGGQPHATLLGRLPGPAARWAAAPPCLTSRGTRRGG